MQRERRLTTCSSTVNACLCAHTMLTCDTEKILSAFELGATTVRLQVHLPEKSVMLFVVMSYLLQHPLVHQCRRLGIRKAPPNTTNDLPLCIKLGGTTQRGVKHNGHIHICVAAKLTRYLMRGLEVPCCSKVGFHLNDMAGRKSGVPQLACVCVCLGSVPFSVRLSVKMHAPWCAVIWCTHMW
jgi:hypothetical protein